MSSEARKALDAAREAIWVVAQKPLTKLADDMLGRLSRIIRRTLSCGQLEKLEDARPYLTPEPTTSQPRK